MSALVRFAPLFLPFYRQGLTQVPHPISPCPLNYTARRPPKLQQNAACGLLCGSGFLRFWFPCDNCLERKRSVSEICSWRVASTAVSLACPSRTASAGKPRPGRGSAWNSSANRSARRPRAIPRRTRRAVTVLPRPIATPSLSSVRMRMHGSSATTNILTSPSRPVRAPLMEDSLPWATGWYEIVSDPSRAG